MFEILVESAGYNSTYDITEEVSSLFTYIEIPEGILKICAIGSTIGLTLMRYEQGAVEDLLAALRYVSPEENEYAHYRTTGDPNGFAHVRSSLIGTSVMVPYKDHSFVFSSSHRIILFDFDLQAGVRKLYVAT